MGCSTFKEDSSSEKNNYSQNIQKKFDEYPKPDKEFFDLYYYQLLWKNRPTICFFQIKEQEKINKLEVSNFPSLLKQKLITEENNIEYLIKDKLIIIYIHITNGVIITRNQNKVNYYLMNNLDNIISISLVDISNVNLLSGEKFSIYELKNQSKYYFNLSNKELDFSQRNELVSMGKNEEIFEKENIIEDEELEEKNNLLKQKEIVIKINKSDFIKGGNNEEKESFFQSVNGNKEKDSKITKQKSMKLTKTKTNNKIKNLEIEKEILNDIETFKPKKTFKKKETINLVNIKPKINKSVKIRPNKINIKKIRKVNSRSINKKNLKNEESISFGQGTTNINNIEININITNNHNNINLLSSSVNLKDKFNTSLLYEIQDKTLIIKTYNFTPELNKELEQIFYFSQNHNKNGDKNNDNYSPYDYIIYPIQPEERKKTKKLTQHFNEKIKEKENNINNSITNINKDKKTNGFIIIHNRHKIPFDQRKCKNDINKISFEIEHFNLDSTYYLKEFIDMITNYKNLTQIKFGPNVNNSANPNNLIFWKYLKKLFQENFNIFWVSLKNSNLDDNIIDIFLSSLLMKRIRYLNISNNNLTNKAMYFLNKFLIKNQTLSVLYMNKNFNITVEGLRLITNALQMHPNILKLDISNIYLEGSGQFIAQLLFENKCLEDLNLRNINLSKNDMAFIASKLVGEEVKLKYLDLGLNKNMGDEGLKEIGKIIGNNKSLKFIGLDGLNLTMNNYLPIFEAIMKNRNIESYSLNMNSGLPFKGILNFFLKNQHFKEISITPWDIEEENEENKFTEDQLYAIKKFHFKAPHVIIKGISFIEGEEVI